LIPQTNPIVLNSLGLPANPIWVIGGIKMKFVFKDASGATVLTVDNISGINDTAFGTVDEWVLSGFAPTYISGVSFSVVGDKTLLLQIGRRIKTQNTSGFIYSVITNSVFSAGLTAITVTNDTSVLDVGLSAFFYSFLSPQSVSLPNSDEARAALGVPGYGDLIKATGTVYPSKYGFISGMTDATTALQACFDAAATAGLMVQLGNEVYNIPTGTLTIPSGVTVQGIRNKSIIRRTSDTAAVLVLDTAGTSSCLRDVVLDSTAGLTATNSVVVSVAAGKTFTVTAGATFTGGDSVIMVATADAKNYMLGTVTSYIGTSLVINATTAIGSGTFTAWKIGKNNGENCALRSIASIGFNADGIIVKGGFYVGVEFRNSADSTISFSRIESGVLNRGIYLQATSGSANNTKIMNCTVRGGNLLQYGININGSTAGDITNCKIIGNQVDATAFQGIEIGGAVFSSSILGNDVEGVLSGVSILVQRANTLIPQKNVVQGNSIIGLAGTTGIHVIDCFYTTVSGNSITGGTAGIRSSHIASASGCFYTTVSGNTVSGCSANGILFEAVTANLSGQSSISGNTVVVCGVGIQSTANTTICNFVGNTSVSNTTNYSLLGAGVGNTGNL
jgi:hypothetical protein